MNNGSGLRGFTSGLERGVGLASTMIDGKRRRAFEDERMAMAREQHQRAGLQFQREGERHDRLMKTYDVNAERDAQRFEWEGQEKREQAQARKQNARLKRLQIEEAELKRDLPAIQSAYQKIVTGRPELLDQSEIEAIKRNPRYNPVKLGDPSVGEALKIAQMALKGEVGMRDPKVVEAANILFEADINKGSKGSKRITRFAPGMESGTLVFELDADGNLQPMTAGRGTSDDGDNEVLQQPLADLVKRVAGMQTLHGALQTPEAKAAVAQLGPVFGLLQGGSSDDLEYKDGAYFNKRTGEMVKDHRQRLESFDNASLNTAERVVRNFWGKMNDKGQWVMEEGSREKYAESLKRTEELANLGVPVAQAAQIATMSIAGVLGEDDAKKQAEKEARDRFPGLFDGGMRDEFISQRTPEIIAESQEALAQYLQITSGGRPGLSLTPRQAGGMEEVDITKAGSGQPQEGQQPAQLQGSGTKEQPFKAVTQDHVDWFKSSAPQGAVIEIDGKLFTR